MHFLQDQNCCTTNALPKQLVPFFHIPFFPMETSKSLPRPVPLVLIFAFLFDLRTASLNGTVLTVGRAVCSLSLPKRISSMVNICEFKNEHPFPAFSFHKLSSVGVWVWFLYHARLTLWFNRQNSTRQTEMVFGNGVSVAVCHRLPNCKVSFCNSTKQNCVIRHFGCRIAIRFYFFTPTVFRRCLCGFPFFELSLQALRSDSSIRAIMIVTSLTRNRLPIASQC